MCISRFILAAFAAVLSSLPLASTALAGSPATVTIRIEGASKTLVPPTQITTTTEPVVKDGKAADSCPGTNAVGALQLATGGSWTGKWFGGEVKGGKFEGLGYSVETILGESHLFSGGSFWDLWIDNKTEEEHGVCGAELKPGDSILLFPECFGECPAPPSPLGIEAPPIAEVGVPVTVTVTSYANPSGAPSPAAGATITGASTNAITNSSGQATLTFSSTGNATLNVSAPNSVRTETTICVHNNNDGHCGTPRNIVNNTTVNVTNTHTTTITQPAQAEVAEIQGIKNGHVYSRRAAPRLLRGTILVPTGGVLGKVQISLQRRHRGHCFGFSGSRARFVRIKCGRAAPFFSVGTKPSFSYLLPARLPRGRYTYEIEAIDAAGHLTKLVDGVSRVVFYVR
jgi:hypothetical protein